ncbi:MAG: outer membrane lipoprotein carrier protein LolA [Tannerella sp.]|jgi:outer membrane lipoprotein-sorting protein|nr:outer membrane lipoprotein carrier protein LolA [Tannerella sp.]
MRFYLLLVGLFGVVASLFAQYQEATEAEKAKIAGSITGASGAMNTMICDFTQVKELSFMDEKATSEGKMYYKKENKIRWEYTKPYKYVFSTDGKDVSMTTGDRTNKTPVKSNRLFGEISKIMIGSVSGKGLVGSPDFDTQFLVGKDGYKLQLTPLKKEIKDIFSAINLFVDKSDSRVHTVELVEKSGDRTVISLKNIKINTTIDEELFSN